MIIKVKRRLNLPFFLKNGFAVEKKLLSISGIKMCRKEVQNLIKSTDSNWLSNHSATTSNNEHLVIRSIDTPSDLFFEIARDPILLSIAEKYAKKKVTPLYVEYFNKPKFCNDWTPPHQDHAFYQDHFDDELGITFWIALDDCDETNGCMHMKPTNGRILLKHKPANTLGFGKQLCDEKLQSYTSISLKSGDALIHGSFTPHYCPANKTARSRRAIAVSFRTSEYREQLCK